MTLTRYAHFLSLVVICTTCALPQNRDSTLSDSLVTHSPIVAASPVQIVATQSGWFEKYALSFLAPLLGSFMAGLIAVYSVRATHAHSVARDAMNSERRKQEHQSRYCGLLFATHSILQNHDELSTLQRKELIVIRDQCIEKKSLIIDAVTTKVPLSLLEKCLLKILDHESFNTHLLGNLITYQHSTTNLNINLDFTPITKLQKSFESNEDFVKGLQAYFDQLIVALDRAKESRTLLRSTIETELRKFPFVNIIGQ